MSIGVLCGCGKSYTVDDRHAGTSMRCKACGRPVRVPAARAAASAAPADAVDFDALDFGAYDVAGDGRDEAPPPASPTPGTRHAGGAPAGVRPTFAPMTASDRAGGTSASNPGNMRIDPALCLRLYPRLLGTFAAFTVAGIVLGLLVKPALFMLCAVALFLLVSDLNGIAGRCRSGDVNPGVVISVRPYLVATLTDLGNAGRAYPAVKVIRAPLGGMTGGPPQLGARVTTASYYAPDLLNRGHWVDFDPVVTETVTRNAADIARLKASIPARQWRALEEVAFTLPPRFGIYYLWEPDHLTKAARLRRRDSRGLVVLAVLAVAIGLVIYSNTRSRTAERNRPQPVETYRGPTTPPTPRVLTPDEPAWAPAARRSGLDRPVRREAPDVPRAPEPDPETSDPADAPAEPDPGRDEASEPAAPAVPTTVYKAGDSVEVKWGGRWFPSTIVKREGRKYRVHYDGWDEGFDEWVRTDRIRTRRAPAARRLTPPPG